MTNTKLRTPYMIAQEKIKAKEIAKAKAHLKKVWGVDIKLKEMSYKEIKKLGGELGMNIDNTKSFDDAYNKSQKRPKSYTRVCKYCEEYYDVDVKMKARPIGKGVCPTCKEKNNKKKHEDRKIKNKIKWERLVLGVLKKNSTLSVKEIAEKLGCSGFPVRKTLKDLKKEGKIKLSKATTAKIN